MILSVSRRTDIPNYYADWFFNRIKEGFLYVRNPMNAHQVSRINLSPETVDCIVFWSKNPKPMLARIDELNDYCYYFQFTLTGYGNEIEKRVPDKHDCMIPIFQRLSKKIGPERVIWRYDPIMFTPQYTPAYHLRAFQQIAERLEGFTSKCALSFIDSYAKIQKKMRELQVYDLKEKELLEFCQRLAEIAAKHHIKLATCAENIDLSSCGIEHNSCIDRILIERLLGCALKAGKDKYQRKECGCIESVEIGAYHTCVNGCEYCYANDSQERALRNYRHYSANSPILCGRITDGDKVTERKVKSLKMAQLSLWDC